MVQEGDANHSLSAQVVRFSEPVAFPGATTARFAVLNGSTSVAINGVTVDGAGTSVTLSLASRSATAVPIFLASTSVSMASGFHSGYTGVELTEAAGTASISANASANDLTGNGFNNVLSGGGGADALTGSAGADDFLYASNSDSLLGTTTAPRYDRIRDLLIGTDTITMTTAFAAPAGSISHRGTASALSEAAWLKSPNRAIACETPLDLLFTEIGARQVDTFYCASPTDCSADARLADLPAALWVRCLFWSRWFVCVWSLACPK